MDREYRLRPHKDSTRALQAFLATTLILVAALIFVAAPIFAMPAAAQVEPASAQVEPASAQVAPAPASPAALPDSTGILWACYFHRTIRCETCLSMERYIRDVIHTDFASDEGAGRLRFRAIDFELPENADIVAACGLEQGPALFLAWRPSPSVLEHRELPVIWELIENPPELADTLRHELRLALAGISAQAHKDSAAVDSLSGEQPTSGQPDE